MCQKQFCNSWKARGQDWEFKIITANGRLKSQSILRGYLIDYPSLKCGGMLELVKENEDSLVFKEVLTYGADTCYNNGKTVLIKAKENKVRYYWYFENNGKKAAVGKLSRQIESGSIGQ